MRPGPGGALRPRGRGPYLLLLLSVVGLDQATKWLVDRSMDLHESRVVVEGLMSLTYVQNRGAAFGVLSDAQLPYQSILFSLISIAALARSLRQAVGDQPTCLMRLPLGWSGELWDLTHPLDYLGYDGGGGIGSGPGMAIGAAIAGIIASVGRSSGGSIAIARYMMNLCASNPQASARPPHARTNTNVSTAARLMLEIL